MAKDRSRNDGERPIGDESLEICLLGPFRVVVDSRVVTERQWSRRKPALLIKLLALQPHHQLHREQMIELLWPDSDPESAINNLHKAIHLARHALEPELKSAADSHFVLTRGQQIVLSAPGKLYIDVEEFERQADDAIKSNDAAACETAIGLYRGDLLNEDPYEDWAAMRREQSRELYHRLLINLSQIYEAQGDHHQSIEPLRKLIAADTANEEAHRDLMRLYALTGNRHQALRQYQQCVESLRRELDAQPEPATIELHRQIESGLFRPRDTVNTQGTIESIAILPLLNDSGDPEMEYLSDGLTENIINNLSQLPALRVMAWGTVARFKGRETTPAEVGRTLGVRVVLTGRMLQLSERLIVRAELIDAADGARLWGDAYDRKVADIFAIQEDIAREISENLRFKLTGEERQRLTKRHTENTSAYHAYLKGRYYWNKRDTVWLRKGVEHFRQAFDLDPSYALAYAGLSDSYTLLVVREAIPPEEGFPRAKAAATRALEIDERLAEAHASLGHAMLHNWDWVDAEFELKRAIELNSGYSSAHHWYSEHLSAMGRCDESIAELNLAAALDPLSLIINADLGRAYYYARQYDQGIKQEAQTLEMDPHFWLSHINLGRSFTQKGMHAEALGELLKANEASPDNSEVLSFLGFAYAAANQREEAIKILDQLRERSKLHHVPPYHFAILYAGLGDKDTVFEWLERAFERHAVDLFTLKVEPMFDILRDDERFADLLRRVFRK